jgi:Na+/melibiose symporter-like transporter
MKESLKDLGLLALLATLYFTATYFAVAALAPTLATDAAFLAGGMAMVIYLVLFFTRMDRPGLPLALAILLPVICVAAGVIWWVMRLLGFWEPLN